MQECRCGCGQTAKKVYVQGHNARRTVASRFSSHIQESSNGCWEWTGSRLHNGYGSFIANVISHQVRAHRVSWELHFGSIPPGLWVLHKCDNRSCVRPDHLFLGTVADNQRDMKEKGRSTSGERNPNSKFTDIQVLAMRDLRDGGMSYKRIADLYGTSSGHAYYCIAKRKP